MGSKYLILEDPDDFENFLDLYDTSQPIVVDTESTGLDPLSSTLLGFSFYQPGTTPAFVPVNSPLHGRGISIYDLRTILDPFFDRVKVIEHNAKYDMYVKKVNGFVLPELHADTIALIHCCDPTLLKNLETRVREDFGYDKKTFEEIIGKKWDNIVWESSLIDKLGEYAASDAYWTYQIYDKYYKRCEELDTLVIHDMIEVPMSRVLLSMHSDGILIDLNRLEQLKVPCKKGIDEMKKKVYDDTGFVFNLSSPKQKAEVFYDKLGYKCPKATKTGNRSTDKFALEYLANVQKCKAAEYMIEHSALNTLYTSFITAIPNKVHSDGRLRCNFNSTGTDTGRFSSSNPNLQNQPTRGKAKEYPVRSAFVAPPGYKLGVLDYSQIELRVAAHLSKDPMMIQAFKDGRDIHQEVADRLRIERRAAKDVNFGIFYGLGAESLASRIGVSRNEADAYIKGYYRTYSGVTKWKKKVESKTIQRGYIKNLFGRIRMLPNVKSNVPQLHYGALRQAVNTAIQGTAADMLKVAMIRIHEYFVKENVPAKLLLTVHDELVFEVRDDVATEVFYRVKHIMENVVAMDVPILAEGKLCDNWNQSKDDDFIGYQDPDFKYVKPSLGVDALILASLLS